MTQANRWLLPDGVDEILPPEASNLETLRREILDLYRGWGYDLVITPLIEFLDSLMIIPGADLQLETFKVVDQLTGRTMGIRADITSQVARIDAHVLQSEAPSRLCYADSVLHTKPGSMLGSRSPIKIGAELYGHRGTCSDLEVISLMLETLQIAGIDDIQLSLGHVGIYRSLIENAGLDADQQTKLFEALQSKSEADMDEVFTSINASNGLLDMLLSLSQLSGDETVLDRAEEVLKNAPGTVMDDIRQLRQLTDGLRQRYPEQSLYFDLSELRGYEYHTGVVFGAYTSNYGSSIAKGGRYDEIGAGFGRSRAATGFDSDLKTLLALTKRVFPIKPRIYAPADNDPDLLAFIKALRTKGEQVVRELAGQEATARQLGCDRVIKRVDGNWQLEALS